MKQSKKEKSISEIISAFSEGKPYPGDISGSKGINILTRNSEAGKNNSPESEEREKILGFASEIFLKEGFYKTSMDEIAARLHMSKKTIYKNFPSKEELVKEVMTKHMYLTMQKIKAHLGQDSNAVEKLFDVFTIVGQNILKVNEKMIMDLQFYSPALWKEVDDFRTKQINTNFSRIFEQGKAEGYFVNIKTEIIISIFASSIRAIVNPDFAIKNEVNLKEAFIAIIEILMNGIMNEKGKKIFNKLKNGVTK